MYKQKQTIHSKKNLQVPNSNLRTYKNYNHLLMSTFLTTIQQGLKVYGHFNHLSGSGDRQSTSQECRQQRLPYILQYTSTSADQSTSCMTSLSEAIEGQHNTQFVWLLQFMKKKLSGVLFLSPTSCTVHAICTYLHRLIKTQNT